ncbi:ATPase [Candidatus Thorarchaeota archaeon]|nr:MAG: ATPase [Candidatus Thorarchaeota archaeon]
MMRTKTGIKGFDELVGGGLISGSTVLLSGGTGSGKTVFGLQFLYNGASEFDEPGVYVTIETRPEELRLEAQQFGWNLTELEKSSRIAIIDAASSRAGLPTSEKYTLRRGFDMSALAEEIYRAVDDLKARRLVVDCVSALAMRFSNPSEVRAEVFRIGALLREIDVTSLLISETVAPGAHSRAGVEQFVTQGLVTLNLRETNGRLKRDLTVWKMRQTEHSMKTHPFTITRSGIEMAPKRRSKKS